MNVKNQDILTNLGDFFFFAQKVLQNVSDTIYPHLNTTPPLSVGVENGSHFCKPVSECKIAWSKTSLRQEGKSLIFCPGDLVLYAMGVRVVLLSLASLFLGSPSWSASNPGPPPNIILVLADDLGFQGLSCYGQTRYRTPNIDRLASEGMRFTQAYAGSSVCAPARSTLMTGLHTGHTPVRANGKNRYLYPEDTTLAEVLKQRGYQTGGFGKWGLGNMDTPGMPLRQGFDEWFGQYSQVHAHFFYPYWVWHNTERFALPGNEGGKRGQYVFDETHQKALHFIRRKGGAPEDGPFFAYLPYLIPHVELVVPEDSEAPFRSQFPQVAIPDPRPGYLGSEHAYATYAGMMHRLDRAVGEILALLQELKIDDRTLVIFTSDNGPQGSKAWDQLVTFFDSNGPLRGTKGDFYEGGIRVPFLARWPGRIPAGSTSHEPIVFWDVLPTLAAISGSGPHLPRVDGVSFAPVLLAEGTVGPDRQRPLYWEYPYAELAQCLRQGAWKLVKNHPKSPWELFNLEEDPSETTNVISKHPGIAEQLREEMARLRTPERDYAEEDRKSVVSDFVR